MSAPKTNIETQKSRHHGPLIGMFIVVVGIVGLFIYWLLDKAATADAPLTEGEQSQVEEPGDDLREEVTSPASDTAPSVPAAPPPP